jgi:hypothetical protein
MSYIDIFAFNIELIILYKCNCALIIIVDYNSNLFLLKDLS